MKTSSTTKRIRVNGSKLKIAIILPYFNENIGLELLENTKKTLLRNNVKNSNIKIFRVAGALEIPFACLKILKKTKIDGIIALGAVIRGETKHFDLVCETTYQALMNIQLEKNIPIIFGILACENIKQAKERASEKGLNKGSEAAEALLLQTIL